MRPLELALEGFTSFRTEQRIDFAPLDLFAIIGPTGAGKSSILDAMTFALYGLTMRSGKQAGELVSQGASVLKVQFRFVVRAVEYRVTRTWRYRPSTPEIKIQLERLDTDDWNTLATGAATVQKLIESILGMDFDTFTRVILLPQGKFDEFLKGDAPKRRELLRQLAGLEIYERMRKEAGERARAFKAEREANERQLTLLEVPTPDETFVKREQLAAVENGLPGLSAEATAAEQCLADEERLFQSVARLAELKATLGALTAKDVTIDVSAERLVRAQRADRLKGDRADLASARTQQQATQGGLADAGRRQQAALAALGAQQTALAAAQAHEAEQGPALQAREHALTAAKAYEEQRVRANEDAIASARALSAQTQSHARAEAAFKLADAGLVSAQGALEAVDKELSGLQPGGDRLVALSAAARPLSQWSALKKQQLASVRKLAEVTLKREAAETYVRKVAERLVQVQGELTEAKRELEHATQANGEAALHDHARLLRAGLKPGAACLACGGDFDPATAPALAPSSLIDLAPLQALAADRLERSHKGAMVMNEAETKLEAERAREREAQQDLKAAETDLAEVTSRIDALLGGAAWDASALEAELSALDEADRRFRAASDRHKTGLAAFREAEQALGFARQTLADAAAALETAKAESERRTSRLAEVEAQLHALTGGQPYEALAAALGRDRALLQAMRDQAASAHQAAHDANLQADEALKQAEQAAKTAADRLSQAEETWANALLLAGFTDASYAEAQATPADQEAWQMAIEAHAREKVRLATLVEELAATIGDRAIDEEAIARSRAAVTAVRQALDEANGALADLKAWLQVAESKQKTAGDLMTQVEQSAIQEQVFHTLSRDLKADEFQDYLLEFLQADLVSRATVILRELSDERYALRMREGEFWVEDNWNGGDARRVRTLSGGEIFATSLSMALALSEKLAMGSELGSLFLDEGFGTLDAETLESVTQILESLRAQNRMIGVITHVKSLGERLPTQIKVSKAPEGSRVMVESL